MQYVDFKCRNKQKKNPSYICCNRLGGPAVETINNHDFNKSPFIDLRRCSKCGWVRITMKDPVSPPLMEVLGRDVELDLVVPEQYYGYVIEKSEQ